MYSIKKLSLTVLGGVLISMAGCYDDELYLNKTARPPATIPGDYADHPNPGNYPYPSIIKQTFIPDYDLFDHTKCIAWRIEWPIYAGSVDTDQIPSYFATSKGSLNSFDYLQSVSLANKEKLNFSLYLDNKVEAVTNISNLWALGEGLGVDNVKFKGFDATLDAIEYMATERPELFEIYWDDDQNSVYEAEYEEGDFFLYKVMSDIPTFGGIRIVSESPRIIEVYLALPNE